MLAWESKDNRRIIWRFECGQILPDALIELADDFQVSSAWVQGLGAFRWVEMCEYDQEKKRYRSPYRVDSACEILSLIGNLSFKDGSRFAHLHVTVSRETKSGIEINGGHFLRGELFAAEVILDDFPGLELQRTLDPTTGLSLWSRGCSEIVEEKKEGEGVSWSEVAQASLSRSIDDHVANAHAKAFGPQSKSAHASPSVRRGDWIQHPAFGLCKVESVQGKDNLVIRTPEGRHKTLRLSHIDILEPRTESDRRIFPVAPRK